jgi:TolB protein
VHRKRVNVGGGQGRIDGLRSGSARQVGVLAALGVLVLTLGFGAIAQAAKDDTTLVSLSTAGNAGDGDSLTASVSNDGRFVAFESNADNFSADDTATTDIFVRDLQTNVTILVSRATGAGGDAADVSSFSPSISADGTRVAFQSAAENLSDADSAATSDIFVRDWVANTTTLVSRQSVADGGTGGDAASTNPAISPDGGFVAFESVADNLTVAGDDAVSDIFVRDLAAQTTTLASRATGAGGAAGDGNSENVSIALFGAAVAFHSAANNLSDADVDGGQLDVFVRDLSANTTTFASRATGASGAAGTSASRNPSIGAFAGHVAFESDADNLSTEDEDAFQNIFVRNLAANTTTLASRATGAAGAGATSGAANPSISAAGGHVAFDSGANNLSTDDDNSFRNVFFRNLAANTTDLVSRQTGANTEGGNADSHRPSISPSGRFVAFDSAATNFSAVAGEDAVRDVFLRDVLGATATVTPPGDTRRPVVTLQADRTQTLGRAVKVTVSCDEPCDVVARGKVKPRGARKVNLRPARAGNLAANERRNLKLKLGKKAKRVLRKASRGTARITATGTDDAGNTGTDRVKVKLR